MKIIVKALLIIIGIIAMTLGVIGIFLPLLPTTPLLLLAAACFIRSSEKLYMFIINNKHFGVYIRDYREGKGIPKKTKVIAIGLLWISIGISVIYAITNIFLRIMLTIVASAVTVHIVKIKTKKAEYNEELNRHEGSE